MSKRTSTKHTIYTTTWGRQLCTVCYKEWAPGAAIEAGDKCPRSPTAE